MKNKALVVWVIALLLFGMAVGAQAESAENALFSSGDWSYRVRSDGSLEIAKWKGEESELVIPATIDGKKVVAIGDRAFWGCYSLTSIKIPDSVTSIGGNPFVGYDALQIDISPDHPTIALIDNALFYKPEKRLVTYLESSKAETYTIPQGILSIGDGAFGLCDSLTSVTIPDSVTSIGDYAFEDCDSLTSITIPGSVTSIGDEAFWGCGSLTSITIPDSVASIGDSAFYRCRNLTSVTIPGSVTSIGDDAFFDCPDTLQLIVDRDSYAKEYAKENNLSYNYPDALD